MMRWMRRRLMYLRWPGRFRTEVAMWSKWGSLFSHSVCSVNSPLWLVRVFASWRTANPSVAFLRLPSLQWITLQSNIAISTQTCSSSIISTTIENTSLLMNSSLKDSHLHEFCSNNAASCGKQSGRDPSLGVALQAPSSVAAVSRTFYFWTTTPLCHKLTPYAFKLPAMAVNADQHRTPQKYQNSSTNVISLMAPTSTSIRVLRATFWKCIIWLHCGE